MLARALVAAALLLAPAARAAAVPDFGAYYALVVGINAYADPGLTRRETPVNDASAVHDLLRLEYGYRSTLLLNPTHHRPLLGMFPRSVNPPATKTGPIMC